MKTITKLLTIVSILTLSILFSQCTGKEISKEQSDSTEKSAVKENSELNSKLKKASESINAFCPANVDEYTRFDKTEVLTDETFCFYFTVLDDRFAKMDKEDFDIDHAKSTALALLKQKEWTYFKKQSVRFLFNYEDRNGRELMQLEISPEDYK